MKYTNRISSGQGSPEYLVILAMILCVAMVGIALLGGFTRSGGDARMVESQQYWANAWPFSITETVQQGRTLYMKLENKELDRLFLTNISVDNTTWADAVGFTFAGGSAKTIALRGLRACNSTSYDTFEYWVNFTYTTSQIPNQRQVSSKQLVGHCIALENESDSGIIVYSAPGNSSSSNSSSSNSSSSNSSSSNSSSSNSSSSNSSSSNSSSSNSSSSNSSSSNSSSSNSSSSNSSATCTPSCSAGKSCCNGICCARGWTCSNGACCNPGHGC